MESAWALILICTAVLGTVSHALCKKSAAALIAERIGIGGEPAWKE